MVGLLSSFVGGLVIGVAYFGGVSMAAASADLSLAPNQMMVILVGGLGGLLGSIIDSILGARWVFKEYKDNQELRFDVLLFSLQFSGKDVKTGKIVEVARDGVVPISGKMVLDNHSVNLISSILTALLLPKVALSLGL